MKSKFYTKFAMVFMSLAMFTFIANAQTTLVIPLSVFEDACEETMDDEMDDTGALNHAAGYMDSGSSDLELCTEADGLRQIVGFVWRDVQIPVGATITNAYVQFVADDDNDEVITVDIWGGLVTNAVAPIGEADGSITTVYPKTATTVAWTPDPWTADIVNVKDQEVARTPDISTIITEIISQDGWALGNNLCIMITDDDNMVKAHREAESGKDDLTEAPALVVTFTEGGGGGGGAEPVTIESIVVASADDAEEAGSDIGGAVLGEISLTSSDLEIVFDSEMQYVGQIFRDIQVPVGATVTNAYIQFVVDALKDGVTDAAFTTPLTVYGVLEANTADITETPFSISSRPSTTATVAWSPGPSVAVGDAGVNEQTPDLSAIINEIIGLDGWASGNPVMLVIYGDVTQSEDLNREMESADGDGGNKLVITYTESQWPAAVEEVKFSSGIYPNPAQDLLTISNPSADKFSYAIYSVTGKMIASRDNNTGATVNVDLSTFAKGMYLVDVRSANKSEVHKLIVK